MSNSVSFGRRTKCYVVDDNEEDSLLARLWEGNASLAKTYWILSVMGGFLVGLIILFASKAAVNLISDVSNREILSIVCVRIYIFTVFEFFCAVSIWRSANKYEKTYPNRIFWAYLAYFSVFLKVMSLFVLICTTKAQINNLKNTIITSDIDVARSIERVGGPVVDVRSPQIFDAAAAYRNDVDALNVTLPKKYENSQLDRVALQRNRILYYSTWYDIVADKYAFASQIKPSLISKVCNDANSRSALAKGITITYIYNDWAYDPISTIDFIETDCER